MVGCILAHAVGDEAIGQDLPPYGTGSFLRRSTSGRGSVPDAAGNGNAALAGMVFLCHFEAGGPAPVEVMAQP